MSACSVKNRTLVEGQRVRVYYNLHKQCLSVKDKRTGLVVAHKSEAHLSNVKYLVSARGLEKIRREKRKAVIAYVEGDYCVEGYGDLDTEQWSKVYFNPYVVDEFMVGNVPIHNSKKAVIVDKNIFTLIGE